jgi:hypothetical protein
MFEPLNCAEHVQKRFTRRLGSIDTCRLREGWQQNSLAVIRVPNEEEKRAGNSGCSEHQVSTDPMVNLDNSTKVLDSRDNVDQTRAQDNRQIINDMFESDAATKQWSPAEKAKRWPESLQSTSRGAPTPSQRARQIRGSPLPVAEGIPVSLSTCRKERETDRTLRHLDLPSR